MPVSATTLADLRSAIYTRILAISSDYSGHTWPWRRMRARSEVPGTVRGFLLNFEDQRPWINGGIFTSDLASYEADLHIWTGYSNLNDETFEDLISADMRQLWVELSASGGSITGLIDVIRGPWVPGDESQEGARYGAHLFTVRYLLEQP